MHVRKKKTRRQSGSMLTMTIMCVFLLLTICIIAFGFYLLLTEQQRGQSVTDRMALAVAKEMNENDRIGQLNNLIAANRELVYWSRYVDSAAYNQRELNFATPLCDQLLNEAKSSTIDLDKERTNQINLVKKTIQFTVDKYNVNTQSQAHFRLPWWESYEPQIVQVACGSISKTASNVLQNPYFPELTDWDDRYKYVQPKSNLYNGNINAQLMSPDNDVPFDFASLAAPVEQTISPARLVNAEVFELGGNAYLDGKFAPAPFKQIPSAVQVTATMKVASRDNKDLVRIGSVATCNGAQLPPAWPDDDDDGMPKNKNLWGSPK